ncbi:MAG: M23 family metallopeptidase [Candidatus Omnitrophota bacterium]
MKKKEKNYSIIIMTGATSTSKEFVISSKFIKNAIIAISVLLLIFGFIIFDYLTISFDKEKMKRLEKENIEKETIIARLYTNINDISGKLQKMAVYKKRIAVAMGLDSPNSLTEVGTGGPISSFSADMAMPKPQVPSGPTTETILKKTDVIRQDASKIELTLENFDGIMNKQKVRLACTPTIWPTKGFLTSGFGERIHPFTGQDSFHNGQDIATQYGNKIISPADGVVLLAERQDYYGNLLVIDHGFGYTTRYGHLSSFNVREGQRVKRFQVIGLVGSTGRSSAPHLHYEVRYLDRPLNPLNFIIE